MGDEVKHFENQKDNNRFKDIHRAQTKVLAEKRRGFNMFMKFGQILKDSQQCKMYASEDQVPEFSSSEEDINYENLTPRSNEIYQITKEIKRSFKEFEEPPKTKLIFYKFSKTIGRGAFGKVNLAMHILARKLVAIKTIKKEYTKISKNKKTLDNEVSILTSLDSPYFIKLYDYFDDNRYTYLVTTLCEGGDLMEYILKRKKIKEEHARHLFKNISIAIQALHNEGIAHRDIKPDNILI